LPGYPKSLHRSVSSDSSSSSSDSGSDNSPDPRHRQPYRASTVAVAPRDVNDKYYYARAPPNPYYSSRQAYSDDEGSRRNIDSSRQSKRTAPNKSLAKQNGRSHHSSLIEDFLAALGLSDDAAYDVQNRSPEEQEEAEKNREKLRAAVQAALTAGAIEAWRTRKAKGSKKNKAARVLIATLAAGGLDTAMARYNKGEHLAGIAESIIGGLAMSSTMGGQITHRRGGGPQGKAADGLIAVATSKLFKELPGPNSGRSKSAGPSRRKK